ncbi:hypothetical protein UlMin_006573 [Ulmus minor]
MTGLKSVSRATLLVLGIALIVMVQSSEAQFCTTQQNNLNVCGQFVVPGTNSRPSTECCSTLRSVDHDCFCNTLPIASRLPSLCDIPPLSFVYIYISANV